MYRPEASIAARANGERVSGVPGSQAVAGHSMIHSGTWESYIVPKEASNEPRRRTRKYGGMAVGLARSRGVGAVMPIESPGSLEGVKALCHEQF